MGEVIDLNRNKPHISGEAVCLNCKHKWVAVCPVGNTYFECPECSLFKGVFTAAAFPDQGEFYRCNCGCCHFVITPQGCMCCLCGLYANI